MDKNKLLEIWDKAQNIIRDKIGNTSYDTWIATLRAKDGSPNSLLLEAPDEFFKNWVEEHYRAIIQDSLQQIHNRPVEIEFITNPKILEETTHNKLSKLEIGFQAVAPTSQALNPRFTFEGFVEGSSNRFAHAACLAVAESPAKAYNPLFIYGGVGLGKTHLMQSITHHIINKNPAIKSCYITSERFTNELIGAIQHRTTAQFRQKYRNIDILMVDDIQFIAGKESTQEEFFHTFNVLYDNHKQIVISSDRQPKSIANLEERLSSRFSWGLITDIQPPDFETRVAILRKKIEREPIKVPDEVILFIAQEIKSNIRELEGALVRVLAYSLMEEKLVSLALCREILKDMVRESHKKISIELIQKIVADNFSVPTNDLKSKRRNKNIVLPRQIAMYLSRELTNLSLPEIGVGFGGKDHTTILYSWNKIKEGLKKDGNLKNIIERITNTIQQ
ncbi:MAG: chromosomal replication initiator protein DnaA [Candidatus Omnitrophota bacterium]|nr:chromosomal replication initiator protein DnaA [Candidatus Omnitrophota bacterium]